MTKMVVRHKLLTLVLIAGVLAGVSIFLAPLGAVRAADVLWMLAGVLVLVAWIGKLVATARARRWGLFCWVLVAGGILILGALATALEPVAYRVL